MDLPCYAAFILLAVYAYKWFCAKIGWFKQHDDFRMMLAGAFRLPGSSFIADQRVVKKDLSSFKDVLMAVF